MTSLVIAQIPTPQRTSQQSGQGQTGGTSNNKVAKFDRPPVEDYKIISIKNDTTTVDTTQSIAKEYRFNYLRKDRYALLPFANTGQTYNTLIYDFEKVGTMPLSPAQARHFNYMGVEDIKYFHVPTPLTELYYRSAFQQGQQLDAFFTMNTHPRLNFSIAYKGVRSLGTYQNALTSSGNFRSAFSYRTKNDRYHVRAHWVAQDLLNQENGGLQDLALEQFASNDSQFNDRSRLLVQFQDAENILDGTRVYVNHHYNLIQKKDSVSSYSLRLGHVFNSENKFYEFRQTAANEIFGDSFEDASFRDRTDHEETYNELNIVYEDKNLGELAFQANTTHYDYGYKSVLIQDIDNDGVSERIPNRLVGDIVSVGGRYHNTIGGFDIEGDAQVNVVGDFDGYSIQGEAGYAVANFGRLHGRIHSNSSPANYNHLLYQSNYLNYNWHNAPAYDNVKTNTLSFGLKSKKWLNADVSVSTIDNLAYFALSSADTLIKSFQSNESINYLKVTAQKEIRYGKFALNAAVTFQQVSGATDVFNVPEVLTRSSIYFTDRVFKKALFLQTGFNLTYFTAYKMNAYDPILAEFYVQNEEELGGFPLLDFFINVKVRQTRIFIKAEHFNSKFTGNDFFSAPGYPYRDFNVRFGIVWNFFL
ncbi:MAG: hypothetical protein ACJARZ_002597 [Dokdonia sp.]|jgi:hypothetical protein